MGQAGGKDRAKGRLAEFRAQISRLEELELVISHGAILEVAR